MTAPLAGCSYGQAAYLRWDVLKEDVLVWCVTHQPFMHGNSLFQAGSPPHQQALLHHLVHMERATHNAGQEICQRFNFGRCNKRAECYFTHRCWVPGCGGEPLRQGLAIRCTTGPVISSEFTPLYDQLNHTTLCPVNSHHSTSSELTPLYNQ